MFAPRLSSRLIALLLGRRKSALAVIVLLTAFLGWHALALRIDPGVESMIPVGGGDFEGLRRLHALFGSDEVVVLAFHSNMLFSRESLARLDRLTRRVAEIPHVARVLSPTNVRDLEGDELGPVPVVPYSEVVAGRLRPEALGQRLGAHPIFGGLLVAKDARTAAILVELQPSTDSRDPRGGLVADLRRAASDAGPDVTAYVAGIPVEKVDVTTYIERDQKIFVPLVFLIIAMMTAVLYRHPLGMIVPLSVLTFALVCTLGLFEVAGRSLNPVTSLMTPVILVMSLEGTIQLINQYLAARARGLRISAALEYADGQMRLPCFNAALTAAIGFVSLLTLPIPAIRDFGLFTAAGIMIGYGLTIILTPLLLASLPDFPPRVIRAFEPGPVERGLSRGVRWVCEHPRATALSVGAVLAIAAVGVARIRIETDLIHSLRHASPLAAAARFIDAELAGVNSVEIMIPGVHANDAETLEKVARLEEAIRGLHGVRKVMGLPDLLARVNRAVHRGDDKYARLPAGSNAGADLDDFLAGLRKEAPAELQRFLVADSAGDRSTLRVNARVTALDTASSQVLFAQIRDAAERVGLPQSRLTGNFVVLSNMSTTLVKHQAQGLAVALVLILGVMAIQFHSIRLGLLCAIPNIAPILIVYGLMGWNGIALSVPTAMIASVAIGTIVDNSIYLLARFRDAFAGQEDYVSALISMVCASGRAVVFSTLTLVAGFWVGVFSSFLPTVHFGILTGAAFLLGLVSQFVVLPLTLVLFRPLSRTWPTARFVALLVLISPAISVSMTRTSLAQESRHDILLKDQFGKLDGPARHQGQAVLLIYGKVEGMRRMKAWEDNLRRTVPGTLVVLRGLDARSAQGKKTEAEVNERLQRNVPDDIAILVDWNGDLVQAYGLPDAEVSTTILDAKGRACSTVAGPVTSDALEQVRHVLMRMRETGTCP